MHPEVLVHIGQDRDLALQGTDPLFEILDQHIESGIVPAQLGYPVAVGCFQQ